MTWKKLMTGCLLLCFLAAMKIIKISYFSESPESRAEKAPLPREAKSALREFLLPRTAESLVREFVGDLLDGERGTMASIESAGFFYEPDWRWMLRKLVHMHQVALEKDCELECGQVPCRGESWWQLHLDASFNCPLERRVGPSGLHGKWICDPHRIDELANTSGCLVYSLQEDDTTFRFESAVHNEVSQLCEIHVFSSKVWQNPIPLFVQHHVRQIGSQPPAVPIERVMLELGHAGRRIDILNIDCNGCEWEQYQGWFHGDVAVRQLIVRLSWPTLATPFAERPREPFLETPKYPPPKVPAFQKLVRQQGFVVTHKEFDTETCYGNCVDVSFLNLSAAFQHLGSTAHWPIPSRRCFENHPGLGPFEVSDDRKNQIWSTLQLIQSKHVGSGLSLQESAGFMDEADDVWLRRKQIHSDVFQAQRKKNQEGVITKFEFAGINRQNVRNDVRRWWYHNFDPNFNCDFARRLGRYGDGGKWVCDPHRLTLKALFGPGCLVYSVGSNGDISFETAVHRSISPLCEIHTFDLNPWSYYTNSKMPDFMHFHNQQIGANPPAKSFPEIVNELQHSGRTIDIFKIDCEGCEWDMFQSWFDAGVDIRMILIELHACRAPDKVHSFFSLLHSKGYAIYRKEPNTIGCRGGCCQEYAFIKLHPDF